MFIKVFFGFNDKFIGEIYGQPHIGMRNKSKNRSFHYKIRGRPGWLSDGFEFIA